VAISCPYAKHCVALGQTDTSVISSVFDGVSWSHPSVIDSLDFVNPQSISCSSLSFCAVVGAGTGGNYQYNSVAYTQRSDVWSSATIIGPSIQLVSVSCTSDVSCITTGSGQAYEFTGATWNNITSDGVDFGATSCPSPTTCMVVGDGIGGGVFTRLDNGVWSGPNVLGSEEDPKSVSCPSEDWCMGVGDQTQPSGSTIGDAYVYNGSAWNAPQTFRGSQALPSVSCSSQTFCAAVGEDKSSNQDLVFLYQGE
jgi:hypothetical protein